MSVFVVVALLVVIGGAAITRAEEPRGLATPGVGPAGVGPQTSQGSRFTYQGYLTKNGSPVNAACDFAFNLYDAVTDGNQVGIPMVSSFSAQPVTNGLFTVELDFDDSAFTGNEVWLSPQVKCPDDSAFTSLTPRQKITGAPYALTALTALGLQAGTGASNSDGFGRLASSDGGVVGYSYASSGRGVYGVASSAAASGVVGFASAASSSATGVSGMTLSPDGYGGYFYNASADGTALYATGSGSQRYKATLRVNNTETNGGMAGYSTNSSQFHNTHFGNSGTGGVLYLQNGGTGTAGTGGGDFITAMNVNESDTQFRVLTTGGVLADAAYSSAGADFAEMLPAAEGLEPGDVLAIDLDGKLTRSTQANQTSVVGVYSTEPGFVGGRPVEGDTTGQVPLAVVGVVPVKATVENGAIQPGDLLVASSAPGHSMKASPNPRAGTIIGKSLGSLPDGSGTIKMLVSLQ